MFAVSYLIIDARLTSPLHWICSRKSKACTWTSTLSKVWTRVASARKHVLVLSCLVVVLWLPCLVLSGLVLPGLALSGLAWTCFELNLVYVQAWPRISVVKMEGTLWISNSFRVSWLHFFCFTPSSWMACLWSCLSSSLRPFLDLFVASLLFVSVMSLISVFWLLQVLHADWVACGA